MNNSISSILGHLILAIALVVVSFMAFGKVDKFLKLMAMGDCGKISTYETVDGTGIKISYPVKEVYENCLKEKGY